MGRASAVAAALAFVLAAARPAMAQQPLTDVLSFLLTNRSITTANPDADEQAAIATRDAIAALLLAELSTRPFVSPATGFTYRLDPDLGASVRSSDSFGAFFTERSLTGGRQLAFGVSLSQAIFDQVDGRPLRDGTLVATAGRITGETAPFDVETLTLDIQSRSATFSAQIGLTDRLDLSAAVPLARINLNGERVDTYHGEAVVQAVAVSSAWGLGDAVVRAKYNLLRRGGSGLSLGADVRLATGDPDNLLGSGRNVFTPRLIASLEFRRLALHGNLGYAMGGISDELDVRAAGTFAVHPRMTIIGEVLARRLSAGGRLVDVVAPHPGLTGVETIRLSATEQPTTRTMIVAGVRWNVTDRWVVSGNVLRPLSSVGLFSRWVPTVSLDYSFGR